MRRRRMTTHEREWILHMLGLAWSPRWSDRNYVFVRFQSPRQEFLENMRAQGYVGRATLLTPEGDMRYWATEAGIRAAGLWNKTRRVDRV